MINRGECIAEEDYLALKNVLLSLKVLKRMKVPDDKIVRRMRHVATIDGDGRLTGIQLGDEFALLRSLPSCIGQLKNLKSIHLGSTYHLSALPEEIGDLINLEVLYVCAGHEFSALPSSIGKLKNLKRLRLSGAVLSSLPEEIGDLTNLEKLVLNTRYLPLPPSIRKLKNLKELHHRTFTDLPVTVGSRSNLLTFLRVDLISLPEEMGELTSLETLNLTSSTIESFPHSIGKLKNLKNLQLRHTKYLSTLPEVIGDLSSLEKLDLDDSNIASLPSSIGRLKNLENLDLRNTRHLSGLPEEIGELTRLETLTLCFSAIVSLPPSIGKLKNLKRLYLSYTKNLSTLPEEIGNLTNLQKLDLLNSGITALPDSLVCLKAPLVLYIKLTKIPELQQEDHEEFLTQLVQQCQSLVGVFSIVSHDHGFDAYGNELHYALAYNRYKYNIEFGIISQDVTPKLWPFALQNAKYAFRGNKFYISWYPKDAWYYKSPINQHDAIYRLLVDGRESFNQMLLTRRKRH